MCTVAPFVVDWYRYLASLTKSIWMCVHLSLRSRHTKSSIPLYRISICHTHGSYCVVSFLSLTSFQYSNVYMQWKLLWFHSQSMWSFVWQPQCAFWFIGWMTTTATTKLRVLALALKQQLELFSFTNEITWKCSVLVPLGREFQKPNTNFGGRIVVVFILHSQSRSL